MSNAQVQMSNEVQNSNVPKVYDLEERTAILGERAIMFTRSLHLNPISTPLINQLVRSGTSVGANYMEADGASTKKDFKHKISICRKEAKETRHWLRMIAYAVPEKAEEAKSLSQEAQELVLIFSKILSK